MNALLFVNLQKKNAAVLAEQIKLELKKHDTLAHVFSFDGKPENFPSGYWDIGFTLGGDGTVLYAARCLSHLGVPILPINLGSLGFLAEVSVNDWLDVFLKWKNKGITPSQRCMFNVLVLRDSKIIAENFCLNDAVVSCTGIAKLIKLNVHIKPNDDIKDKGTALGTYRCDGLIISTPTGSTAYSMAAGGPILDPEMEAVIVNPICPFALSNRPYVLTSRQTIVVTVAEDQHKQGLNSGVLLTIDGQDIYDLECDDKVIINQSAHNTQLIYPGKFAYYSALRNKLFWSGE
ncbi:MAG: NAD(+)/NADH kinase [Treponema sp.]|jgi:NAD+ kinase|nr:NAD(+)/NADH kinase [Treponema sp.]